MKDPATIMHGIRQRLLAHFEKSALFAPEAPATEAAPADSWQLLYAPVTVGLCYGIESNIVRIMAQYIVKLVSMRGELDSVLRAAYCHEGENYLALMEYYTPEEHGMVPFTRI